MFYKFLALSVLISTITTSLAGQWHCIEIQTKQIHEGINWVTQNCTSSDTEPPLLTVNTISIDLTRTDYRVVPASADPIAQLQTLPDIAASVNQNFIAGINGGYFWRVDTSGVWRDNVCRGKTRDEAEQPVSSENVNFGIGDGVIKVDGKTYSNNCDCYGYSRPAIISLDGQNSNIEVLNRGDQVNDNIQNALGAGPNLVSFNTTSGKSFTDIPSDDDNINRLVYEATASVGFQIDKNTGLRTSLIMVETDGSDSCKPSDSYCGIIAKDLAMLLQEAFQIDQAMSMDQGGSTTMWIKGENPSKNGVVSRATNTEPAENEGARNIANGLFIELIS
jgi:exopolysaccharide biosynthesis protein